jgi:hypothetical protein
MYWAADPPRQKARVLDALSIVVHVEHGPSSFDLGQIDGGELGADAVAEVTLVPSHALPKFCGVLIHAVSYERHV